MLEGQCRPMAIRNTMDEVRYGFEERPALLSLSKLLHDFSFLAMALIPILYGDGGLVCQDFRMEIASAFTDCDYRSQNSSWTSLTTAQRPDPPTHPFQCK